MTRPRFRVIQGGRRWTRPEDFGAKRAKPQYGPSGSGWRKYLPLWLASILLGLIVAFELAGGEAPGTAKGLVSSSGERVKFSLCVWGGGTNCVVDGDTIYLHGTKIRIAGIDAPETHDFKCPAEKALGDRATMRLQELLNSGPITLSRIDRDEDVYGRKLRNVAVNGADVGDTLISEGLSRAYRGSKMGWC